MGQPLPFAQDDLYQRGHAIECRIYAEDPARGFLPSPGTLRVYRPPIGPGLRLDDGVVEGDEVPRYYDPMIAKLSAWAPDRPQCIARMQAALQQFEIAGVAHNIKHLQHVLASAAFQSGRYDTGIVGSLPPLPELPEPDAWTLALAAVADHRARRPADTTAATADSAWSRHARSAGLRPK
jgi:acetyl/propionyl-CoA carboxylase alpha subunit